MRITDRAPGRILSAPFDRRHWRALKNALVTFDRPVGALARYLANAGRYPWCVTLLTPSGPVQVCLRDRHDLLTVMEIFCRRDYGDGRELRAVLDIGANVGLATLFFLTRGSEARSVCYEPDPGNFELLQENLRPFGDRVTLVRAAVTATPVEIVHFVPAGRYGHTATEGEVGIAVPAVDISAAVTEASAHGVVDLVKIDTEGTEPQLVAALRTRFPGRTMVRDIVFEDGAGHTRWA